jgi:hypothetical protein
MEDDLILNLSPKTQEPQQFSQNEITSTNSTYNPTTSKNSLTTTSALLNPTNQSIPLKLKSKTSKPSYKTVKNTKNTKNTHKPNPAIPGNKQKNTSFLTNKNINYYTESNSSSKCKKKQTGIQKAKKCMNY